MDQSDQFVVCMTKLLL